VEGLCPSPENFSNFCLELNSVCYGAFYLKAFDSSLFTSDKYIGVSAEGRGWGLAVPPLNFCLKIACYGAFWKQFLGLTVHFLLL